LYFNVPITSRELQMSRLGLVSAGEANVSVSSRSREVSVSVSSRSRARAHPCILSCLVPYHGMVDLNTKGDIIKAI